MMMVQHTLISNFRNSGLGALVIIGLAISPVLAQTNLTLRTFVLGDTGSDAFQSVDIAKNGDLLVGGVYQGKDDAGKANFEWMAVRLNTKMEAQWLKTFGAEGDDFLLAVKAMENGDSVLIGNDVFFKAGDNGKAQKQTSPLIVRLDSKGETLTKWRYVGSGGKYEERSGRDLSGASVMANGDIILTGPYVDLKKLDNRVQAWVSRVNTAGEILWENLYGGVDDEVIKKVVTLGDGGLLLVGTMRFTGDRVTEGLLIKLDGAGKQVWRKQYAHQDGQWIAAAAEMADGNIAIVGTYRETTPEKVRGSYLTLLNADGGLVWNIQTTGTSQRDPEAVIVTQNNELVIAGYIEPGLTGKTDIFISRYSAKGKRIFDKQMGGKAQEYPNSMAEMQDGLIAIAAQTSSVGKGKSDGLVFTIGQNGELPNFGK